MNEEWREGGREGGREGWSHLAILEYKEANVSAMVDLVLPKDRRGEVLDPHTC